MKDNLFQMHELDALLGDFKDDFDVEGIIQEATEVREDGNRYWTVFEEDLNEILARHDKFGE